MFVAAAVAASVFTTAAAAQEAGDWVLSRWDRSNYVYPGVVQSRHGNTLNIRFDDGSVAPMSVGDVRAYDWRVGSNIECRWTDGGWYAARIESMADDGLSLTVVYEDGTRQRTNTGRCRSL